MKIAICDDNKEDLERINSLLNEYITNNNYNITVDKYTDSTTLLNRMLLFKIDKLNYDILILDVVMETTGIEFVKKIKEDGYNPLVIFLSTSKEFAVDAFKVRAFDYLLKPYEKKDVFKTLDNALRHLEVKPKANVILKLQNHTSIGVNIEDIIYADAKNRRVIYHMADGKEYVTTALRTNFIDTIPFDVSKHNFIFSTKNKLVNMDFIKSIKSDHFILKDDTKIPISLNMMADVKKKYISYLLGGEINNG